MLILRMVSLFHLSSLCLLFKCKQNQKQLCANTQKSNVYYICLMEHMYTLILKKWALDNEILNWFN